MEGKEPVTVDLVARRAEGNPFFAEELARLIADDAGRDPSRALNALPQSVQAVVAARIDALSAGAKTTLMDAAVVGAAFWRGSLEALAWPGAEAAGESLAQLVDRQLVQPVRRPLLEGEEEYAFCHGMVREVAYGEVPRAVRARKHAAFARWLEGKVGERARGDLCDVLAWHYGAAAELARAAGDRAVEGPAVDAAVGFLTVSGERAMGLDVRAAVRHFERALSLAVPGHPARPSLLSRAAEALFQEGRYRQSDATLQDAAVGLSAAGDRRGAALAAARRADVLYALGDPGVTAAARGGTGDARGRSRVPGGRDRARQARPLALAGRRPAGRARAASGGARPRPAVGPPGAGPLPRLPRRDPLHHGGHRAGWPTTSAACSSPASAGARTRAPCSPSTTRMRCSRTVGRPLRPGRWPRGSRRPAAAVWRR